MDAIEQKLKHLEFLQNVISRMAHNSFLLKGWAVTLVGGLLALSFKESYPLYLLVSLVVLVFFLLLDSYYLTQERLFIKLYNKVRIIQASETDFSMDVKEFRQVVKWWRCAVSRTMILFYGGLLLAHLIIKGLL